MTTFVVRVSTQTLTVRLLKTHVFIVEKGGPGLLTPPCLPSRVLDYRSVFSLLPFRQWRDGFVDTPGYCKQFEDRR